MNNRLFFGIFLSIACMAAPLRALWPFSSENFVPTVENLYTSTLTPYSTSTENAKKAPQVTVSGLLAQIAQGTLQPSVLKIEGSPILHIETGITIRDDHEPLFLFSPYFTFQNVRTEPNEPIFSHRDPGGSLYGVALFTRRKFINGQTISFCHRDTLATINFGQALDQQSLEVVWNALLAKAPNKKTILFGACRGASNILRFLVERAQPAHLKNLQAVVLEAPPLSLELLIPHIIRSMPVLNYLPGVPSLAYGVVWAGLPNHKAGDENVILDNVSKIPKDLPILIVHLQGDGTTSGTHMIQLIERLKETGHTHVHLLVIYNKTLNHAKISLSREYLHATNAFLKFFGLPHDSAAAELGEQPTYYDPVANKKVDIITLTKSMANNSRAYIDNPTAINAFYAQVPATI